MGLSLFQIANILLLIFILFLLIRFLWTTFFNSVNQPASWKEAKRDHRVSVPLIRLQLFYPDKVRFYNWWIQVERLNRDKVPGAFAELGVYRGESARILHLMDPVRKFHLYDTFQGFMEQDLKTETGEAATYTPRHFAGTSVKRVLGRMRENDQIHIHPGYFPESASQQMDERFALVNLDVDLYNPTRAGLEFFYPRMNPGGVILVHDYNRKWPGVIRAADEFLLSIPEKAVLIPDRYGTLVVIKG